MDLLVPGTPPIIAQDHKTRFYGRQPVYFETDMFMATTFGVTGRKGTARVPAQFSKDMTELIGNESNFRYWISNYEWGTAKNARYQQWGYGMVDKWHRDRYAADYGLNYNIPYHQIVASYLYCIEVYGSVPAALEHWRKHGNY
jgi:hypothetical protein